MKAVLTVTQDPRQLTRAFCSGIFGYINYLVEKDRKFILNTLINGMPASKTTLLPNLC